MPPQLIHFFAQLLNPRPHWPDDMTPSEEQIMAEHFEYLKNLAKKKKVLIAGPCFDPVFGMIVLQVENEDEAVKILSNDPSVRGGLMSFKYQPMRASIVAENINQDRYVTNPSRKLIRYDMAVPAAIEDVWNAWTTTEGINTFFSSHADIELKLGGRYEVYFLMDRPYGERGSEDCRVLSFLPFQILSFEWNAPPEFGPLRDIRTQVILQFEKLGHLETRVVLTHLGWGTGDEWDNLYEYFQKAWTYVLGNLKKRFIDGPLFKQ